MLLDVAGAGLLDTGLLVATVAVAALVFAVAFAIIHLTTPFLIRYLEKKGNVVVDILKPANTMVVRPGGPALLAGAVGSEAVLYIFFPSVEILALILTTMGCFIVGYVDDRRVMSGWFKPTFLAVSAAPILLLGANGTDLAFPLFGSVEIPLIYMALAPLMICITGNTANSIDVMNGLLSGFMVIAGAALTISLVIVQNYTMAAASLPLVAISLAYYRYHRIPCKIFPGDSGALMLGGMYGAIAIIGGVEIVAAVALLPAIVNSFLFLASVKKVVEHRQLPKKPTVITDDLKIRCSGIKDAHITLVALITGPVPHTERQVVHAVFKLAAISGGLAVLTAFMMLWDVVL